jgi:hypothetical protein
MIQVLLGVAFALMTIVLAGSATGAEQSAMRGQNPCIDEASAATADSLAAKFDDHQFVFIGSTHGDLKIEEFLMCLVSRPSCFLDRPRHRPCRLALSLSMATSASSRSA